jgi:hypothetical protein
MIHLCIHWAAGSTSGVALLLWTLTLFGAAGLTYAATIGDQVELRATHPAGVPFQG